MKIKLVTYGSDYDHPGWKNFERSLKKFGWDYGICVEPWRGYGVKLRSIYNYLKSGHADAYDLIMTSDSYDSVMLAPPEEVIEKYTNIANGKILHYGERACWPYEQWEHLYPKSDTIFKCINGGGGIWSIDQYIKYFEMEDVPDSINDQVHTSKLFLTRNHELNMMIDTRGEVLQCMAHAAETDFSWSQESKRVINNLTCSKPCCLHWNGHTTDWVSPLLFAE